MTALKYLSLEELNQISGKTINAAMAVHTYHGPGLVESIYADCLMIELEERGLKADAEVRVPVYYKGRFLEKYKRVDLIVENALLLELKAVDTILPIHQSQVMTYLKNN
jgi:GxxExxY protein